MSVSLVVLCLAAFAMVAVGVSGMVHVALPWLERLAMWLPPRGRVRLWLAVAALPSVLGLLGVVASFVPALGLGHDHCLAHGAHHPHLCPQHLGGAPGTALVLCAMLVAARATHVVLVLMRGWRLSRYTSNALRRGSVHREGVLAFSSNEPQAFVLGVLGPRVHVSSGLLSLGSDIVAAVVAHERVHVRRRDLLWRAVCPVIALGHLPATTTALRERLAAAQELAADDEAAASLPADGRLLLAEALVKLAAFPRTESPGLSFTHGDLRARVRALLEEPRPHSPWAARLLLASPLFAAALAGVSHELIHHGLETLLGALS